jgi:hypothetical protein
VSNNNNDKTQITEMATHIKYIVDSINEIKCAVKDNKKEIEDKYVTRIELDKVIAAQKVETMMTLNVLDGSINRLSDDIRGIKNDMKPFKKVTSQIFDKVIAVVASVIAAVIFTGQK